MDRLTAMRHFLAVVEGGSFSNAAKRLGVANATVTQSIKGLEAHLGVRLMNRTTRQMKLTWEGNTYAGRCRELLNELEGIEREIVQSAKSPCGELRIEVPSAIGHTHIVPKIYEFSKHYPEVQTTVFLTPGASTLIEEGIDVAIQLGDLESSSLIARKVHTVHHVACAAPSFLAEHGMPTHPEDLLGMDCLGFYSPKTAKALKWTFEKGTERITIDPEGPLRFNSSEALIDVARRGGGVIYMLDILIDEHLKSGELVELLPGWKTLERGVYIVSHNRQNLPEKVRAFTGFVEQLFARL